MNYYVAKNNQRINLFDIPTIDFEIFRAQLEVTSLRPVGFFGLDEKENVRLFALLADDEKGEILISSSLLDKSVKEEQAEEARQAEIAKQAKAQAKRADFADVVHDFFCAIGYHYPELGIHEEEITDELCNAMADLAIMAIDMEVAQKVKVKTKAKKVLPVDIKVKTADPFAAFFEQFGL